MHLLKTVQWVFSRGFMDPYIGNIAQPLPYLAVDVIQVFEGTKREKIGSKVFDARFDFTFFMGRTGIASDGGYRKDFQKIQKAVVEPDNTTLSFNDSGQHVVDHDGFGCSSEERERIQQALVEGVLFLTMGELHIEHAAEGFAYGKGVQLSLGCAIQDGTKVSPIDLDLLCGHGLEPDKGCS